MKQGHSYSTISDKTHPKHPLIKALLLKGYDDVELIYASHWASDAGWTCNGHGLPTWLGFTIRESLVEIAKLPTKEEALKEWNKFTNAGK